MSRNIQVSLPSEHTTKMIPRTQKMNGLIGLRVYRKVPVHPKGDVLDFDSLILK